MEFLVYELMAQRRMFSPDIVCSDAFLDMPPSTQALYYLLGMRADDDGFVNPRGAMRMLGAGEDDLKVLLAKRFLLKFETGVVVVKHWLIHNLIRADLYKETQYKNEKAGLGLNENGAYTELRDGVAPIKQVEAPKWLKIRRGEARTANVPQTALRIGKDRDQTRLASPKRGSLTTKKNNMAFKGYNENEFQDDLPSVDAESGVQVPPPPKAGRDPVATRVSGYFFKRASEAVGRPLVNQGYGYVKKFTKVASEDDLIAVVDEFFDREPSEPTSIFKCLNASAINKYLANK